jgi:hypothetical protein
MKKILLTILLIVSFNSFTQQETPPQGINYQAVVYSDNSNENPGVDSQGQVLKNEKIGVRFTIYSGSASGTEAYKESHNSLTDEFGLFSLIIGQGSQISINAFDAIDWGTGYYYLKVEIDKNGGVNYIDMGTLQMWSVPYALYTKYAETAGNGISDVIDNGDGTITFNYFDGSTYTTGVLGGIQGPIGPTGANGMNGSNGINGLSAYEVWISLGNIGTETDFINSLIGPQGIQGATGPIASNCIQIGDYYAGGIVFYVDGTCEHGLVVTPFDLMNYDFNSDRMTAITICNNLKCNGYTDWYLPTLSELLLVYNNLGNAGFREENWSSSTATTVRWYWSSTINTPGSGFGVNFDNGAQSVWVDGNDLRIRAIRPF